MKKVIIKIWYIVLILIVVISIIRFWFGWDEDDRICKNWQWIKHGNPSAEMPKSGCESKEKNILNPNQKMMEIFTDRKDGEKLPSEYTCDGWGRFPVLNVKNIPHWIKNVVLIVDDPDAPAWTRDHLLIANLPVTGSELVIDKNSLVDWIMWKNSRGESNRWAPCPPSGSHRYVFGIYALNDNLNLKRWFSKQELLKSMEWKIMGKTELIWLYR